MASGGRRRMYTGGFLVWSCSWEPTAVIFRSHSTGHYLPQLVISSESLAHTTPSPSSWLARSLHRPGPGDSKGCTGLCPGSGLRMAHQRHLLQPESLPQREAFLLFLLPASQPVFQWLRQKPCLSLQPQMSPSVMQNKCPLSPTGSQP